MAFDHARFFMGKKSTKLVLFLPEGMCSPVVLARMLGLMLALGGANLRAARADDSLNLVGSNALYTVNGQQSFLSLAGTCSSGQVSPLCVDGGATLQIVGSGNTLLSQGQVFIGYTQSGTSKLVIENGGQMRLYYSVMQVGWSGGDGQMTVSGAGSQMVTTADSLLVVGTGDNTTGQRPVYQTEHKTYGTMTVADGGRVLVGAPRPWRRRGRAWSGWPAAWRGGGRGGSARRAAAGSAPRAAGRRRRAAGRERPLRTARERAAPHASRRRSRDRGRSCRR